MIIHSCMKYTSLNSTDMICKSCKNAFPHYDKNDPIMILMSNSKSLLRRHNIDKNWKSDVI